MQVSDIDIDDRLIAPSVTYGTAAGFNNLFAITVTKDGRYIYCTDRSNHKIRRIDTTNGTVIDIAGDGTAGDIDAATGSNARFNSPTTQCH